MIKGQMIIGSVSTKGTRSGATYVVAASDSNPATKGFANYICTGTNDEVQIQAAIDAANTLGGGKVVLSEGNFNIHAVISVYDSIIIEGCGLDVTYLKAHGDLDGSYMFQYNVNDAAENVSLEFSAFSAWGGANLGSPNTDTGFFNSKAGTGEIKDVNIQRIGVFYFVSATKPTFRIVNPWGYRVDTCILDSNENPSVLSFAAGTVASLIRGAIIVNTRIRSNTGTGILFTGCEEGIIAGCVLDNGVSDNTKWSIDIDSSPGMRIVNNLIQPTGTDHASGISIDGTSHYCLIANNILDGNSSALKGLDIASGALQTCALGNYLGGYASNINDAGTDTTAWLNISDTDTTVINSGIVPIVTAQVLNTKAVYCDSKGSVASVSSITRSGNTATVTTLAAHSLLKGEKVTIAGADQGDYNGQQTVLTVPSTTTFTYAVGGSPATPATGTITARARVGVLVQSGGWFVQLDTDPSTGLFFNSSGSIDFVFQGADKHVFNIVNGNYIMSGGAIYGNTTDGGNLQLYSTSHANKGKIILGSSTTGLIYDEDDDSATIGGGSNQHTINGSVENCLWEFHQDGAAGAGGTVYHRHTNTAALSSDIVFLRSRGDHATQTVVQSGDQVGHVRFAAHDGTDHAELADIAVYVDGTPGSDDMPGRIEFKTSQDGGQTPTESFRVKSDQNILVATDNQLQFRDTALGIYSQADSFLDLFADGSVRIGNSAAGAPTNYSEFEADGTLKFNGNATVFNDMVLPLDAARLPAVNAPNWESFVGNLNAYAYQVNDFQEFTAELLHGYKSGSAFQFHIHGALNAALAGGDETVKFEIEYSIADMDASDGLGDVFPATTTINAEFTVPNGTADLTNIYIVIGNDVTGNFVMGATIKGRIRRIASSGTELVGNIFVTQVGIHYEIDTVGSRTVTTK